MSDQQQSRPAIQPGDVKDEKMLRYVARFIMLAVFLGILFGLYKLVTWIIA